MSEFKVLVLEGGFNEEHEVSLSTGKEVKNSLQNLDIRYNSLIVNPINFERDISKFSSDYICFNALHGSFGEDGKIQKILAKLSFKFTHSSQKASSICFNKILSKNIVKGMDILTPEYFTLDSNLLDEKNLIDFFQTLGPFIIKPISSGSSFGIKIFRNKDDINIFLKTINANLKIYDNHKKILIEKLIVGKELTVAVIEKNKKSFPLEVTEIISKSDYFDYKSKYTVGFSKHILPANVSDNIYNYCKNSAKIIHEKIRCNGVSRSDFIYNNEGVFFLEINSQPGLTPISLVPEQLKYQNLSFNDLILNIINCAL